MTIKTANFPTVPWDPATDFRSGQRAHKAPDANDWDEVMAEVVAMTTQLYPIGSDSMLWVAPHGKSTASGSITNPYASIALALAAVTADDTTICVMPGTYTHAATLAIVGTYTGIKIVGIGGSDVTILDHTTDDDAAISIIPAIATAFVVTIRGITVLQYAAKIGIAIDDTGQTANGITVNLDDVKLTMDTTGDSLDVTHAVDVALLLNIDKCVFTGLTDLDIKNTSDVFTFRFCQLKGVASDASAVAMSIRLFHTALTAITGGNAAQVVHAIACTAEADLTLFVAADVTGSQTVTLAAALS